MIRLSAKYTVWLLTALLFWAGQAQAEPISRIVLLLSADSEPYHDVVAGIKSVVDEALPDKRLRIVHLEKVGRPDLSSLARNDLLVAVGTHATEYALTQSLSVPVFSTFVTRSSLLTALAMDGATDRVFPERLRRAVVLDQPADRVITLAQLVVPKARNLGAVVNDSNANRLHEFNAAIEDKPLQLHTAEIHIGSNPTKDLKQVFSDSDAFIVIPDSSRFNSKIAKWVLFLSYRHRVPVIGYSQKYTDAGALVSLYTSPFLIGRDTGEQLIEMFQDGEAPAAAGIINYPRYFALRVNTTVADSLGLKFADEQALVRRLVELEADKASNDE